MPEDEHKIGILIASPASDEYHRRQEMAKGLQAKLDGKKPSDCPWKGGMMEYWWFEGYDSIKIDPDV